MGVCGETRSRTKVSPSDHSLTPPTSTSRQFRDTLTARRPGRRAPWRHWPRAWPRFSESDRRSIGDPDSSNSSSGARAPPAKPLASVSRPRVGVSRPSRRTPGLDLERRGCSRSVFVDAREVAPGLALYGSPAGARGGTLPIAGLHGRAGVCRLGPDPLWSSADSTVLGVSGFVPGERVRRGEWLVRVD
jgi:hypothetical protein